MFGKGGGRIFFDQWETAFSEKEEVGFFSTNHTTGSSKWPTTASTL
jgi:hypothetical protein